jgi:hypothetical protein
MRSLWVALTEGMMFQLLSKLKDHRERTHTDLSLLSEWEEGKHDVPRAAARVSASARLYSRPPLPATFQTLCYQLLCRLLLFLELGLMSRLFSKSVRARLCRCIPATRADCCVQSSACPCRLNIQRRSCHHRMGAMMGTGVGLTIGFIFGSGSILR